MKILSEIREAIVKLENKNYKINTIYLSEDVRTILMNHFNKVCKMEIFNDCYGINKLFGYDVFPSFEESKPVSFDVTINFEDIK